MKRFLCDLLLVLLLVGIGSTLLNQEEESIEKELTQFEQQVNSRVPYYRQESFTPVEEVRLNNATLLAKKSGETIEEIVGFSVEFIASVFQAMLE